jgi:AcrR family transcriptional regulator
MNTKFRTLAVEEAYALLQAEGIEGLSMRKLANQMGWSTQKLYSNFKNKDELLLSIATLLRERIRKLDLSVKKDKDPLRYLLDLTQGTLQFFVKEPAALEVLMEQRYRLDAVNSKGLSDPYHLALKALNCPRLSAAKAFEDALNSIRLLLVGATYSLRNASVAQRKAIFKGAEHALCSMLRGWGYS